MKNLIIIGARGFGREYCQGLRLREGYGKTFAIKGFLDDKADALEGFEGYPPILSSVEDYVPEPGDVFTCALGSPVYRRKYTEMMLAKGGVFETLINPNAIIHQSA